MKSEGGPDAKHQEDDDGYDLVRQRDEADALDPKREVARRDDALQVFWKKVRWGRVRHAACHCRSGPCT